MATTAEYVATILDLAEQADALVGQFRALMASIEAEESALHLQAIKDGKPIVDTISGRRRLGHYAHALILKPAGSETVTDLANSAWRAHL